MRAASSLAHIGSRWGLCRLKCLGALWDWQLFALALL